MNSSTLLQPTASLRGRDLLGIGDLSQAEACALLDLADTLKAGTKAGQERIQWNTKRIMAMVFEKPSLRTRFTFETAMVQLGGHAIYLSPAEIGLGTRESIPDAARNLERWAHVIMGRVFAHSTLQGLAEWSHVPVINALCDREHPCQALADFQTLREHKGDLAGKRLVFVGDGNNVAHSLLLLSALTGVHATVACPPGYEPDPAVVEQARVLATATGAAIQVTTDPQEAVEGADAVYTDVWASMGQESEAAVRAAAFRPYQVNVDLLRRAPNAIVMHCLPAHRGDEITDDVMDGPQSVVFDQAENRLHAQKAVIASLIGD